MLNSEVLAEVLADLSSTELPALDEAILQAGLLLERERRYAWADEVARHPSRWPRGVAREDPMPIAGAFETPTPRSRGRNYSAGN